MIVSITGVLSDGSSPVTSVPTRQLISVPQGIDVTIRVSVTGLNGSAVDLTSATLAMVIRDSPTPFFGGTKAALTAVNDTPLSGLAHFTLPAVTTRGLEGTYVYDVIMTKSGFKDELVPASFIEIFQAPGA